MYTFNEFSQKYMGLMELNINNLSKNSTIEYLNDKLAQFDLYSIDEVESIKLEFFNSILKDYYNYINFKSDAINEAKEIKSEADFKKYAEDHLKKAFGDKFDQKKADKVINGLIEKKKKGEIKSFGEAIGRLRKG